MNYMTNKIVAIQGDIPSKLNPETDTSIFLANEIQNKRYKIFYYEPKNLSIINSKVVAKGYFVTINYNKKNFDMFKSGEYRIDEHSIRNKMLIIMLSKKIN